jgi:putative restriction endonuclease
MPPASIVNRHCQEWLNRLANLNAATVRGQKAPHKPLLLLTIMDMIEDGELATEWIRLTPDLFSRFQLYWPIVQERQQTRANIKMPFHALGGDRDRVWERCTEDGAPSCSENTTKCCRMDPILWDCLQDEDFRKEARLRLISAYFPADEQVVLYARMDLPEPDVKDLEEFKKNAQAHAANRKKGRDFRFRSYVLTGYRYACALTGYSLNTTEANLVEAAHIHQHAQSGDDDPTNGLALTPDAHWMFDKFLWTVDCRDSQFIVLVAKDRFTDSSPRGRTLREHHEKPLYFVPGAKLRPDPMYFEWHRERFLELK